MTELKIGDTVYYRDRAGNVSHGILTEEHTHASFGYKYWSADHKGFMSGQNRKYCLSICPEFLFLNESEVPEYNPDKIQKIFHDEIFNGRLTHAVSSNASDRRLRYTITHNIPSVIDRSIGKMCGFRYSDVDFVYGVFLKNGDLRSLAASILVSYAFMLTCGAMLNEMQGMLRLFAMNQLGDAEYETLVDKTIRETLIGLNELPLNERNNKNEYVDN